MSPRARKPGTQTMGGWSAPMTFRGAKSASPSPTFRHKADGARSGKGRAPRSAHTLPTHGRWPMLWPMADVVARG
eukprot:6083315-Prymnesium_polylepis.1